MEIWKERDVYDQIFLDRLKKGMSKCCNVSLDDFFFLNKSLPARLKATTRREASRRDRTDFTKTDKEIG